MLSKVLSYKSFFAGQDFDPDTVFSCAPFRLPFTDTREPTSPLVPLLDDFSESES